MDGPTHHRLRRLGYIWWRNADHHQLASCWAEFTPLALACAHSVRWLLSSAPLSSAAFGADFSFCLFFYHIINCGRGSCGLHRFSFLLSLLHLSLSKVRSAAIFPLLCCFFVFVAHFLSIIYPFFSSPVFLVLIVIEEEKVFEYLPCAVILFFFSQCRNVVCQTECDGILKYDSCLVSRQ